MTPEAIDAHPLIREYFAKQLRDTQLAAFQAAHSRLFDHLCEATEYRPDTLDGLQPLYQAVVHGCLAGRQQEACEKVYVDRILRGTGVDGFYSTRKLGAIGADLAAVAAFFDEPWSRVSPESQRSHQAWLLNVAAFSLRALGRLTEALQPMRAGLEMYVQQEYWKNAAISAGNLSELKLTLGRLPDAVADARRSITHADQSGHAFQRMARRTDAADALHQFGRRAEAGALFAEAERIQKESQPEFDLLYSLQGFQYCDWLLATAERAAWQAILCGTGSRSVAEKSGEIAQLRLAMKSNGERTTMLAWAKPEVDGFLDIALDHLTLARVGLFRAILTHPLPQPTLDLPHVAAAVNGLRNAGQLTTFPEACSPPRCITSSAATPHRPARPSTRPGDRRARTDAALPRRHPPAPRPPLSRPSRACQSARPHRKARLLAAQRGAGRCRSRGCRLAGVSKREHPEHDELTGSSPCSSYHVL